MRLGTLLGVGVGIAAGYVVGRFLEAKYAAIPLDQAFKFDNMNILRPIAYFTRINAIGYRPPGNLIDVSATFKVPLPS